VFARYVAHEPFAALEDAGHNILIEQADLCCALISDWLTSIRGSAFPVAAARPTCAPAPSQVARYRLVENL
jgi:hypothetical protein